MRLWIVLLLILTISLGCDPAESRKLMCMDAISACERMLKEFTKSRNREANYKGCLEKAFTTVCDCSCEMKNVDDILDDIRKD